MRRMLLLATVALIMAAMVLTSAQAYAIPITGKAVFDCVKGDENVAVRAGRAMAQVFIQQGYTCVPERLAIKRL